MSIEFFLTACTTSEPDGPNTMLPNDCWDTLVWRSKLKAELRYDQWKEAGFKAGNIQQMFLVKIVVDIFKGGTHAFLVKADVQPHKKTVVYNKQAHLDTVVNTATKSFKGLLQSGLSAAPMNWDDDWPGEEEPAPPSVYVDHAGSEPTGETQGPVDTPEPNWEAMYAAFKATNGQQ